MRKMINRVCQYCEKKFQSRLDEVIKFGWGKYCSMKCQRKGRKYLPNSGQYKKGNISFNKGKHPEYLQGKNHHNWKGGKNYDSRGYILIKQPKHPFCNNNGYIREHRLVMEKHIGRYLKPKEQIHHINKIKDDNRIENLKLFSNASEHIKQDTIFVKGNQIAKGNPPNKGSFKKGNIPWNKRLFLRCPTG